MKKQRENWISWAGGECPVAQDTQVECRLRSGAVHSSEARGFHWRYGTYIHEIGEPMPPDCDIIAYRRVTQS